MYKMQLKPRQLEILEADASSRKTLRTELETAFQTIFKQCTMKGPLHDHWLDMKYLLPKMADETNPN
jgi:hypothetical protein